jgi:hypothetical protein
VFDPQDMATEVERQADDDQAQNAEPGYYTPAITCETAEAIAKEYGWD